MLGGSDMVIKHLAREQLASAFYDSESAQRERAGFCYASKHGLHIFLTAAAYVNSRL